MSELCDEELPAEDVATKEERVEPKNDEKLTAEVARAKDESVWTDEDATKEADDVTTEGEGPPDVS